MVNKSRNFVIIDDGSNKHNQDTFGIGPYSVLRMEVELVMVKAPTFIFVHMKF